MKVAGQTALKLTGDGDLRRNHGRKRLYEQEKKMIIATHYTNRE
jgi:hypothetical protein